MSDSSSAVASEDFSNEEYTKPAEFLFCVEEQDGSFNVTICPEEYFEENGFVDDQFYRTIDELLEENDFISVMESTYEYDPEDDSVEVTKELIESKMRDLGFKESDAFNKFMQETTLDYSFSGLEGDGSERGLSDLISLSDAEEDANEDNSEI